MVSTIVIFVLAAAIILIWVMIEFKRLKHKLFAWFLIGMILLGAISFTFVTSDYDIDYSSVSGLLTAGKVYFFWLGSLFGNFKSMTGSAVEMDWGIDDSVKEVNLKDSIDKAMK